jgi:hypothetical protein
MSDPKQDAADSLLRADVPTFYANSLGVGLSPYDFTLVFGLRVGDDIQPQTRVIMSLEHALVMLMVGRRVLREHARANGVTPTLPQEVMRDLQLDEEDPLW